MDFDWAIASVLLRYKLFKVYITHFVCRYYQDMTIKPTVAFRALFVGGIAAFAKIAGAMKAAGGVKLGAAAAAMTAAATATMGTKQDAKDASKKPA